jgi:hypothetical protein
MRGRRAGLTDNRMTSRQVDGMKRLDWTVCSVDAEEVGERLGGCLPVPIRTVADDTRKTRGDLWDKGHQDQRQR